MSGVGQTSATSETPRRGFRIAEAARYMGVTPWFVELRIRSGELRALKLCRHYTILRDDMDKFLDGQSAVIKEKKGEENTMKTNNAGHEVRLESPNERRRAVGNKEEHMKTPGAPAPWFVVDKEGLKKTLERKGKIFAIYELVQNGWDEDATEVRVTLTRPENGYSNLMCKDNSPTGYRDLSIAHTMFGESYKKADPTKRGRFNIGEKHVVVLCDEATITSTSGSVHFNSDGTRTHSANRTKQGSEFKGKLPLTEAEWTEICSQVKMLCPPIPTFFNDVQLQTRPVLHEFQATLPTEVADDNGILRRRERETAVRLYEVAEGEKAHLYEKGLPVVDVECRWHVDIQQKVPLNIERDNVTPSYLKAVLVAVVNERKDHLTEADAESAWVATALASRNITPEATKAVIAARFGNDVVLYDATDPGSNKEAVSKGKILIPRGTFSREQRDNVTRVVKKAGEVCPTNTKDSPKKEIEKLDDAQSIYRQFIERLSPLMIQQKVTVRFIEDERAQFLGCTKWEKDTYIFTVNIAHHDVTNWHDNYELFIHELAHHAVQSNDHLVDVFYDTVTELAAKLVQVALEKPELFPVPVEEALAA